MRSTALRMSLLILCAVRQLQIWIIGPWASSSFGSGLRDSLKYQFGPGAGDVFRYSSAGGKVNYVVSVAFNYATIGGLVLAALASSSVARPEAVAPWQSPSAPPPPPPSGPPGIDRP